jgi:hypothetical protein
VIPEGTVSESVPHSEASSAEAEPVVDGDEVTPVTQ